MSGDRLDSVKKKRLQNACDECRRRKVRCDSEKMPKNLCSSCLNLGIPCTHLLPFQKRGPKRGTLRITASQPVHVLVTNILKGKPSEPFTMPDDKESIRRILLKLAYRIQELDKEQNLGDYDWILGSREDVNQSSNSTTSGAPLTAMDGNKPDVDDKEDHSVEDLSNYFAQFSFDTAKDVHFGESSNMMLMKAVMDHGKEITGSNLPDWQAILAHVKRPQFWQPDPLPCWFPLVERKAPVYDFPPTDDLHRLIGIYFVEWETYHPLLHRPSFEKSISEGFHLRDHAFGAVVLAVCALGADIGALSNQDEPGDRWITQIRLDSFVFSQNLELYHLQLYCLMITYFHCVNKGINTAWLLAGIAIRRAQEKGVHRRYNATAQRSTIEEELWKRAFWMLINTDMKISTLFGRPRATSIQDFDIELLIECDDEYWEPGDRGGYPFAQPPGKPSKISFSNSYLKLMEIYGFAMFSIYSVRKSKLGNKMGIGNIEWYEKAVMGIDSALNKWVESVPEHLQWDKQNQDPIFFTQSTILYSWYYWVQIAVHRRFIPRPRDSSGILSFPSLAICTNAARSCLRVCETYVNRSGRYHTPLLMAIFNSATVLALNLLRSTQLKINFDSRKEMIDIQRSIEMLRLYEPITRHAGRLVDTLVMMFTNHLPLQPTSTVIPLTSPKHPHTSQSQAAMSNQPPLGPSTQKTRADAYIGGEEFNSTSIFCPNPTTQLPFSSSELGELPIHALSSSFNEPIAGESDRSLPAFDYPLSQGNFDPHSFFDDLGIMSGSSVVTPDAILFEDPSQNYSSATQDWNSFMANVDQLLGTGGFPSSETSFDPFDL